MWIVDGLNKFFVKRCISSLIAMTWASLSLIVPPLPSSHQLPMSSLYMAYAAAWSSILNTPSWFFSFLFLRRPPFLPFFCLPSSSPPPPTSIGTGWWSYRAIAAYELALPAMALRLTSFSAEKSLGLDSRTAAATSACSYASRSFFYNYCSFSIWFSISYYSYSKSGFSISCFVNMADFISIHGFKKRCLI